MNNKVWMTSILALCMATPAMAEGEIANASGLLPNKSCDESTLGVTEGTANVEAIWTANTYSISYKCNANDQDEIGFMTNTNGIDCNEDPTNDSCINVKYAVYDKNFIFADRVCNTAGYQQTGWLCKNAGDANATATRYGLGQNLEPWDLTYNLACVAEMTPNTIGLNWYDGKQKQTVGSSSQQCTYNDANTLVLPSAPADKAGYTFSGWKTIENICARLDTQSSCNANGICFWYVDEETNTGSCVNIDTYKNGCAEIDNNKAACEAKGYCKYYLRALNNTSHCQTKVALICPAMTTSTECTTHEGCSWVEGSGCLSD